MSRLAASAETTGVWFAIWVAASGLWAAGSAITHDVPSAPTVAAAGLPRAADEISSDDDAHEAGRDAFGYPLPELTPDERRAFAVGNSFFKQNWVSAPSSTANRDGLGPLFNARSCSTCHARDGRSRPPEAAEAVRSGLLLRIGLRTTDGPDRPHPTYGDQIQDSGNPRARGEAMVLVELRPLTGKYGDGTPFELVAPTYHVDELAYGPVGEGVTLGGRTAPHLVGLGLLEAIPEATIFALADADDGDGDGVSGRASVVADRTGTSFELGRFGWKATQPSVLLQTAAAFVNDIGITSTHFRDEALTTAERASIELSSGGDPEIDDAHLQRVALYTRSLAVPAPRRTHDAQVLAGRQSFERIGCAACHVPCLDTDERHPNPAFRGRRIHPYTDLLLHDLGPELADGKRDGDAGPQEWRTPPLWGVGLIPIVSGHSRYLHDGRARDLAEAILWHGGEALVARESFRRAPATERAALLAFVRSL